MAKKTHLAYLVEGSKREPKEEILIGEGPLHILLNGESYVTTMRTPSDFDMDLARGMLFTEGIVTDPGAKIEYAGVPDPESNSLARLDVNVSPEYIKIPVAGRRSQTATASCGICGTRNPEDIELTGYPLKISSDHQVPAEKITQMLDSMTKAQTLFHETGGVHGAGAYTQDGTELVVREDIGRHNAVDKVIGALLEYEKLSDAAVLTVSGRVSYEIVAKVYRSQIPILVAVSAPSSMAVETALSFGITLIAFCRDDRMTLYSHPERIKT